MPKNPTLRRVGAYPIKHHLKCPERTRKDVSYDKALKVADTDGARIRMESGIAFEATMIDLMLAKLAKKGYTIVQLETGDGHDSLRRIDELKDPAKTVVNIVCSGERTEQARERIYQATLRGMSRGVGLMFGTRLVNDEFAGEPDGLGRWEPAGTPRKRWTYFGLDFKEHKPFEGKTKPSPYLYSSLDRPFFDLADEGDFEGVPQLVDGLQLVMYQKLLASHGRAGAPIGGIIGNTNLVLWHDLDQTYYVHGSKSATVLFDETYESFRDVQSREWDRIKGRADEAPTAPVLKNECGECPWREVCLEELEDAQDISLLTDITPSRGAVHRELGVVKITQMAKLDWPTARLVEAGVDVPAAMDAAKALAEPVSATAVIGSKHEALLTELGIVDSTHVAQLDSTTARYAGTKVWSLTKSIDQARVWKSKRVHRARGVAHVEIPRAAVELDVDIEDDSGGICYLIGVRETIRSRGEVKSRYVPFVTWENTPEAEAAMFAEFWAYVMRMQEWAKASKTGVLRAYFYTEHESRYFRHLAKSHADKPGVPDITEVEAFLESDAWFDMHPIIGKQLVWPVRDRTLKTLAKYVRFFWRDETPGGANSVAWYREALATEDPERAEELKTRLLEYNEDDVEATFVLREWVSRFGEARRPGTKLPEASELDQRYNKRRKKTDA